MRLKVTYTDGNEVEINAGPRAQVALERQHNISFVDAFNYEAGTARVEYAYFLGWAALHFAGREPKDFDDFLGRIADVEAVEDVEPDPTHEAPRADVSPA